MLFMGQEFLEDKFWSDDPKRSDLYLYWEGLAQDRAMNDFHRFMRDLCWLRRNVPALSAEGFQVLHVDDDDRVLVFQRWVPGRGQDVVIVVSLAEHTYYDHSYRIGFRTAGSGTRSSTQTSTRRISTRMRRATTVASRHTSPDCTGCRTPPASPSPRTVCWCSSGLSFQRRPARDGLP